MPVPIAGRTDRAIVGDGLSSIGQVPTDAEIMKLRDAYLEQLPLELPRPAGEPSCVLPGVSALLDALEELPGVHVGLLTGNFERGAELKLAHFDLWRRFSFGAFGDHHLDRRALLPVAIERACAAGMAGVSARTRRDHRRHAAGRGLRADTRRPCAGGRDRPLRHRRARSDRRRPGRADAQRHRPARWLDARAVTPRR